MTPAAERFGRTFAAASLNDRGVRSKQPPAACRYERHDRAPPRSIAKEPTAPGEKTALRRSTVTARHADCVAVVPPMHVMTARGFFM